MFEQAPSIQDLSSRTRSILEEGVQRFQDLHDKAPAHEKEGYLYMIDECKAGLAALPFLLSEDGNRFMG